MSISSEYSKALTTSACCLALKIGVVHLLTVRERLITDKYVQAQDSQHWLGPILKIVMGCVAGTGLGGQDFIDRTERIAKNCAENEPFFLVVAMTLDPSAVGATCIQVFTAARMGYSISYLLGDKVNTAFRTVTYVVGLGTTLFLAGVGLKK